jgi:ketosteroid isomerase-like protein
LNNMTFDEYETEVVDVVVAGNTGIATVVGHWRVRSPSGGGRNNRFILSDTWVKRNGRWAVAFRHATTVPNDNPPAATR